ncbi:hypothetical protein KL936_004488 [Ogataea polymorpha]|nr:hypothetical protein KL936_004488 [Ogataea polymorpha]
MIEESPVAAPHVGQQMHPRMKLPSLSSLTDDFSLPPLNTDISEAESADAKITLPSLSTLTQSIPDVLKPLPATPNTSFVDSLPSLKRSADEQYEQDHKRMLLGLKKEDGLPLRNALRPAESVGMPKTSRHRGRTHPSYRLDDVQCGPQPQLAESIPVFAPSSDQVHDPMSYIESLRDQGVQYGAIKVVLPEKKPSIEIRAKLAVKKQTKNHNTISNPGTRLVRKRDQLLQLGFQPLFDKSTRHKQGLTVPDEHALPSYDFYQWSDAPVDDDDAKIQDMVDLRQFDQLCEDDSLGTEQGFWNSDFDAFYATHTPDLDVHPTGWNLRFLSVCEGSLLQYLNEETNLINPKLRVASKYSFENWSLEDHFLQKINYHHSGAPRLWYFVPVSQREKFEKLLREKRVNRAQLKHEPFRHFVDEGDCFDDTFLISPAELKSQQIDVFATVQCPGELVIKYPQVYSLCVSLGTSVCESVNFASRCWLQSAVASVDWMRKQLIIPAFSTFKLLVNVATNCDDRDTLRALDPVLEVLIDKEMEQRENIRGYHFKESSTGTAVVTEADLVEAFPSYVVVYDRKKPSESLSMSVARFLDKYNPEKHDLKVEFCVQVSDDALRTAQKLLKTKLVTGAEWLHKYHEVIEGYDKPSTKLLKPLLQEGESIFHSPDKLSLRDTEAYETYRLLREYYQQTEEWAARATKFLQFKISTRMRQRKVDYHSDRKNWNELEDLEKLIKEIPQLPISTPEMDQLLEYSTEIIKYNEMVEQVLARPDEKELENLHILGSSFGVKLNSFMLLDRILKRNGWLKKLDELDYYSSDTDAVGALLAEGYELAAVGDKELFEKLHTVYEQAVRANEELAANSDDVHKLQVLYDKYEQLPLNTAVRQSTVAALDEYAALYAQLEQIAHTVQLRFGELAQPDELLRMIDSNLRYFDASFQPSRPLLQEITHKVARYPALTAEHQTLQFYEHQVDVWYEQLVLYFGLTKVKKLRSYFEEWQRFDEQVFAEPPDGSSYCVCRMRHENGIMIECEACEQWFHFGCLGLRDEDEAEISGFLCPICDVDMRFKSTRYHLDQVERKPTLAQLVEFVYWSNSQLTVLPPEYRNILWILRNCYTFKLSISDLLENDLAGIRHALRRMEGCRVNFEEDRRVLRAKVAELLRADRRVDAAAPESR